MKIFLLLFFLSSCSGFMVSKTNNPEKKIKQAIELLKSNRHAMAEKLVLEALAIYEQNENSEGKAKAYLALGEVYKTGTTKDFRKVADSYVKAADINHYRQMYMTEALFLWTSAYWFGEAGEKKKGCLVLSNASKAINLKDKSLDADSYTGMDAFPGRIEEMRRKLKC